jgi:hypothetical protein
MTRHNSLSKQTGADSRQLLFELFTMTAMKIKGNVARNKIPISTSKNRPFGRHEQYRAAEQMETLMADAIDLLPSLVNQSLH